MDLIKRLVDALHAAKAALLGLTMSDKGRWKPEWTIHKYHGEARPENLFAVEAVAGNLLLNEGITELLNLLVGAGGTTAFNNANARLGVGDSTAVAVATQTDLQAAVNKTYLVMDATYPQVSGQTVTFKATAGPAVGNHGWKEFVADNGAAAGKTLNRKVEDHGAKASGDTWVLTMTGAIS
jgi:hypothetical protein